MHRVTLAGYKPLAKGAALSDWAARLAGVEGEQVEFLDSHRSLYRLGIFSEPEGALQAALFIAARKSALPGPATLAALFTARFDNRTAILRGASSPEAPVGRTVCVCHGVTETKIRETIAAGALATVAAVGAACRAGTNCGSCKGEIAKLLADMIPEMA
jgi:assimilatory nitrate reductase catalytic subunit